MTHEFRLKHTTRSASTGLISNISFTIVSILDGVDKYTGKYECNTPGSVDDDGFIAYDSLTSSDLLGFINKYGGDDGANNGLNTYQTINSASFAEVLKPPTIINDLPPNVGMGPIIV